MKTQLVALINTNNDPKGELASLKAFEDKLALPIAQANQLNSLAIAIKKQISVLTEIDGYLAEGGLMSHHSYSHNVGFTAPSPEAVQSFRSSLDLALNLPFGERLKRLNSLFTELESVFEPFGKILSKRTETINLLTKTFDLSPLGYLLANAQLEIIKSHAREALNKGNNQNWGLALKGARDIAQSAEIANARSKKYTTLKAKAKSLSVVRQNSLGRYFELEDWDNIEQCIQTWVNSDHREAERAKARRAQEQREAEAEKARLKREQDRLSTVIISNNYYGSSNSNNSWGSSDSSSSSNSWGSDSGSSSSDSSSDSGSSSSDW